MTAFALQPLANRCPNQIDDLCAILDDTVNSVVQARRSNACLHSEPLLMPVCLRFTELTEQPQTRLPNPPHNH